MTETPDNTHSGDKSHRERGGQSSPRDERSEAGGTVGVMERNNRRQHGRPIAIELDREADNEKEADRAARTDAHDRTRHTGNGVRRTASSSSSSPAAANDDAASIEDRADSADDTSPQKTREVNAMSASGMLMAGEQVADQHDALHPDAAEEAFSPAAGDAACSDPAEQADSDRHDLHRRSRDAGPEHRNGHHQASNGVRSRDDGSSACAIGGGNVRLVDETADAADPDRQVSDDEEAAMAFSGNVSPGTDLVHTGGEQKLTRWARFEAWLERAASRSTLVRKLTSRIYLPLAFHSGLTMKKLDAATFTCVLPFRRFNRNWYNAMAGAALLANSEIAAGMYLFGELGGKWTIVCKNLNYRFLRPCFGPAIYRVTPLQDLPAMMHAGREFNIDLSLEVLQHVKRRGRERRVGRCDVTFHCAPKAAEGNRAMEKRVKRRSRRR